MKLFSLARATAKPLTKLAKLLVFFSTVDCPCSAVLSEQLAGRDSFFLFSSSIFFLKNSIKLPSLANALLPGPVFPTSRVGLAGDAGLLPLESLLLSSGSSPRLPSMFLLKSWRELVRNGATKRKKRVKLWTVQLSYKCFHNLTALSLAMDTDQVSVPVFYTLPDRSFYWPLYQI